MKVLLISKNNAWSEFLYKSLNQEINIIWSDCIVKDDIDRYNPDWIFFFHWSELVHKDIHEKYKCVVVHTSNLPDGRGGSPLQNQILDNIISSRVNLIEMSNSLDSGAIYISHPITLQGNLTDIWFMIANIAKKLILKCITNSLTPVPQNGNTSIYKRRNDNKLIFDNTKDILYIYDQIRMLDADGYPNVYIQLGDYILEFSRAKLESKSVIADVRITKKE